MVQDVFFLHNDRKIRNINLPYFYIMTFIDFISLNKRLPVFENFSMEFDNNKIIKDKIYNSSKNNNSNYDNYDEFVIFKNLFFGD